MIKIISTLICSFFSLILFSQEFEDLYQAIQVEYGPDQTLINGVYFEHTNKKDIGHPYFLSDEFQKGHLIIHNQKFDELLLKFSIFDQSIIVRQKTPDEAPIFFLPPIEYITEFAIDNHIFRKKEFRDRELRFYEEIYRGTLSCLYEWRKGRTNSDHNVDYFSFKYYEAKKKSFIVLNNNLEQYRSKGSYVKLFPPEYRKAISRYMRINRIKVKTSPNNKISELVSYCEKLLYE